MKQLPMILLTVCCAAMDLNDSLENVKLLSKRFDAGISSDGIDFNKANVVIDYTQNLMELSQEGKHFNYRFTEKTECIYDEKMRNYHFKNVVVQGGKIAGQQLDNIWVDLSDGGNTQQFREAMNHTTVTVATKLVFLNPLNPYGEGQDSFDGLFGDLPNLPLETESITPEGPASQNGPGWTAGQDSDERSLSLRESDEQSELSLANSDIDVRPKQDQEIRLVQKGRKLCDTEGCKRNVFGYDTMCDECKNKAARKVKNEARQKVVEENGKVLKQQKKLKMCFDCRSTFLCLMSDRTTMFCKECSKKPVNAQILLAALKADKQRAEKQKKDEKN